MQIQLSTSPSHSILTPGRPVPALTLERQAPCRVATGVPIFESLVRLDPEKIPSQAGFEPGIFRSRGGRLTTRPTWRCLICNFYLSVVARKIVCADPYLRYSRMLLGREVTNKQNGMVWYGVVWYGMVWYGMVWYGMVWYGMVWCGVVW